MYNVPFLFTSNRTCDPDAPGKTKTQKVRITLKLKVAKVVVRLNLRERKQHPIYRDPLTTTLLNT